MDEVARVWRHLCSRLFQVLVFYACSALLIACCVLHPQASSGQENVSRTSSPSEYEVKAAFILNFTKFIEWPPNEAPQNRPFAICIIGDDPFGTALSEIVHGEHIGDRPLEIRRVSRESVSSCEIAFVSKSERDVDRLLSSVPPGVLTVGETEAFLRQGGLISLSVEKRRVRFDIDARAAAKRGFKISSRLLNVARSVESQVR
jgi:hypothetical protein